MCSVFSQCTLVRKDNGLLLFWYPNNSMHTNTHTHTLFLPDRFSFLLHNSPYMSATTPAITAISGAPSPNKPIFVTVRRRCRAVTPWQSCRLLWSIPCPMNVLIPEGVWHNAAQRKGAMMLLTLSKIKSFSERRDAFLRCLMSCRGKKRAIQDEVAGCMWLDNSY